MSQENKIVKTRFAPSPTGFLHIGSLRAALFSFLFAKHEKGKFLLRVEDTDQARFVEGAIESLIQLLDLMNLHPDEGVALADGKLVDNGSFGPYLQSARKAIYREYALQLVAKGEAYYCFCDEKRLEELRKEQAALKKPTQYDRKCRMLNADEVAENLKAGKPAVIRQAIPLEGKTTVHDLVYGEIVYENMHLDDQVLLKSDGFPTYHLAVVVDDHLMQVTHVIRGEEWIPSTPKHILLYQAFDWEPPLFAHTPLILNKNKKKLSKRHDDVSVNSYLQKGYLKEALINFVVLLGWNPKTDQEIFSLEELIAQFDLAKVNKSSAIFDLDKLDWINSIYIRNTPIEKLTEMAIPYLIKAELITEGQAAGEYSSSSDKVFDKSFIEAVVGLEQQRLKKLDEIGDRVRYFFERVKYAPEILIWRKSNAAQTRTNLSKALDFIAGFTDSDFSSVAQIESKMKNFIVDSGLDNGSVLWPLRVALSGLEASPNPFEIMHVLFKGYGKNEIIDRLKAAISALD